MKNVLVVSGHTDLNDSVANKTIMEELAKLIPSVEFDYLDKLYPDYKIDIAAEQAKLEKADVVVLQFPVFWYSLPSLLERWMEETFKHGWSHGRTIEGQEACRITHDRHACRDVQQGGSCRARDR